MVQGAHADSLSILKCRDAVQTSNSAGMTVQVSRLLGQPMRCDAGGCVVPFANGLQATVVELIPGARHTFGEYPVNQVKAAVGTHFVNLPGNFELTLNQEASTDNGNTIPSHLSAEDEAGRKISTDLVCTFLK